MNPRPTPQEAAIRGMNANAMLEATQRLTALMAQESELLETRRYAEIAKLQEEKERLTATLESYQHVLASNPDFLKSSDLKMRESLIITADDLSVVAQDNFRKVAVARAVNQRVLQAIRDVISEQHAPTTYTRGGVTPTPDSLTLSMNLNQKA